MSVTNQDLGMIDVIKLSWRKTRFPQNEEIEKWFVLLHEAVRICQSKSNLGKRSILANSLLLLKLLIFVVSA